MRSEVWDAHIQVFASMKPPLRPHESEISLLEEMASALTTMQKISNLQVLLLGLTIEIINLKWPKGTHLTVVDRSEAMIGRFWPGDIPKYRKLIKGDWHDMSFPKNSFHLIAGDGVFNFMQYPDGYLKFASMLRPLLHQDGIMWIRIFNQMNPKEDPMDLIEEFHRSQKIEYFDFRLRLATSIQESAEKGVNITKNSLDTYLIENGVSLSELYTKSGYTPPEIPTHPVNKEDTNRITYPTDQEFLDLMGRYFSLNKTLHGSHSSSNRTPILVLSPK